MKWFGHFKIMHPSQLSHYSYNQVSSGAEIQEHRDRIDRFCQGSLSQAETEGSSGHIFLSKSHTLTVSKIKGKFGSHAINNIVYKASQRCTCFFLSLFFHKSEHDGTLLCSEWQSTQKLLCCLVCKLYCSESVVSSAAYRIKVRHCFVVFQSTHFKWSFF